jgi:hypothetical protein
MITQIEKIDKVNYKIVNVRLKKEFWVYLAKMKIDEESKSKTRISFSTLIEILIGKNKKYRQQLKEMHNERSNN